MTEPSSGISAFIAGMPDVPAERPVRYSYWPVSYINGDPTVISNAPLPLNGVSFSRVMRGVGMMRASLQLAEPEVRELNPWEKIVQRKTGIVVVREEFDPEANVWTSAPVEHYIVWGAPRDPHTGRMAIIAQTVESLWARRRITKARTWVDQDQTTIAADLLNPALWSKVATGPAPWPGWITIDPPTVMTGVVRNHSYADGQETNLLEAHQARSQLSTNSYEWTTGVRVLAGTDAVSATSFRLQYVMGFPRLGRSLGDDYPVPRLMFDRNGAGNVSGFTFASDGAAVPNIVWGRGNGYEELQTKTQIDNTDIYGKKEWEYGFLQTEDIFSDPDVTSVSTLRDYCYRHMWDKLGSQEFITALTLRGDAFPRFGSYVIGDQAVLQTNDVTWPTSWYDPDGFVELLTRIYGWTVTPPEGEGLETVQLLVSGGRSEL